MTNFLFIYLFIFFEGFGFGKFLIREESFGFVVDVDPEKKILAPKNFDKLFFCKTSKCQCHQTFFAALKQPQNKLERLPLVSLLAKSNIYW
jgi:hypothetical protein